MSAIFGGYGSPVSLIVLMNAVKVTGVATKSVTRATFGPRQANLCLRAFRYDKF